MITTASPLACFSPAAMAISLPKLRLKEMAANRESAAFRSRMRASVPSVDPSSTNSTDQAKSRPSRQLWSSATSASSPAASLRTGMTRVISGRSGTMAARAIARFMPIPKPPATPGARPESPFRRPCEVANNSRRSATLSPVHRGAARRPEVKEERDQVSTKRLRLRIRRPRRTGYVLPPRNPLQSQASRRRSPPGGGTFLAA